MHNSLIDLLDNLRETSSSRTAYSVSREFFKGFGFRYINAAVISKSDNTTLGMFSNMSGSWMDHYLASGYAGYDPITKYCKILSRPVTLSSDQLLHLPSENKPTTDRMMREAFDEGLRSSLLVNTHSSASDQLIGFNLGFEGSGRELQRIAYQNREQILVGAALAQQAIIANLFGTEMERYWYPTSPSSYKLSPREAEVLKWLSAGYRNDRIAEKLRISVPTVNFHISAAKRRLGAKTREQAIAMAVSIRLI